VADLLETSFGQPACSYRDFETGLTTVSVYLTRKKAWTRSKRLKLRDGLARLEQCGLEIAPGRLSLAKVRPLDWAEAWKRHFRPMEVGPELLVKPSWSRRRPRPGQAVVVLDPGLSFGTGQHPTTSFCLRELAAHRRAGEAKSFLDIGTGSGILAIAATKLGYAPVAAFDWDADAIRVARANAHQNGVVGQITFSRADVAKPHRHLRGRYSVVCANLVGDLLFRQKKRMLGWLKREGLLVLAGILRSEFASVRRAYEQAGLKLVASRTEGEWRSGSFSWRKGSVGGK
jgi:ribosomal protein L11 methyltransferase